MANRGRRMIPSAPMRSLLFAALSVVLAAPAAQAGQLDDAVLREMNFARANPAGYARDLARQADEAWRSDRYTSFGAEDPRAVDEAIDFLMRQEPLPPLRADSRLAAAAAAQAAAQARSGTVGHGTRSLGQRLQSQGVFAGLSAENISYGYDDPRAVVRQLIVDSRVAGRGHRLNIFGRGYQAAGVGCGPHRTYGSMCVINFAGAMVAR